MMFIILFSILLLIGISAFYLSSSFSEKFKNLHEERIKEVSFQLEDMFYKPSVKLIAVFSLSPLIFFGLAFFFFQNIFFALFGAFLGFLFPSLFVKIIKKRRVEKFNEQLIGALMEMGNCLKSGLSLIQAMEEVTKDSDPPLRDEFNLVLKAYRVGIPLEEALEMLRKRVPSEYLELMNTAILVGKETGGNLIKVFSKLITTIRDRKKLKEKIKVLTFQGRLQAAIISVLPFFFALFVYRMQPHHFDIMFSTNLGRFLLLLAVVLQIVALILIKMVSTLRY